MELNLFPCNIILNICRGTGYTCNICYGHIYEIWKHLEVSMFIEVKMNYSLHFFLFFTHHKNNHILLDVQYTTKHTVTTYRSSIFLGIFRKVYV